MNEERLLTVLLGPHISEKTADGADKRNQHVFRVMRNARKSEIKAAVEKLFEVKVAAVNTISMQGKRKNFNRRPGKRADWKKAIVTLEADNDIDFSGYST
ncbi:MAG: 50S ribosomal protein L23 [Gammaproteobacteria bacterium]|nr:50S ribosomal protein L23 [Gammaproteobacteria bacterium]